MTAVQPLSAPLQSSSAPLWAAHGEGLTKVFGAGDTRVVALDHVDVAFPREQFTAIMGPSGSGKSTLRTSSAATGTARSRSSRGGSRSPSETRSGCTPRSAWTSRRSSPDRPWFCAASATEPKASAAGARTREPGRG